MSGVKGPGVRESGWKAFLSLGFSQAQTGKTQLQHRQRSGPLAVQRALYPEGDTCHVYLLHPPGGVVGGDTLNIESRIESGHALVTTPGATKFYRSAGPQALQVQTLTVAEGATLEWLPQENILFPGAHARLHTHVRLAGDARMALWEIQCLGRPVIDERFDAGRADFGLLIERDDMPLIHERLRVSPDSLNRLSGLSGHPVIGNLIVSHCNTDGLDSVRALLPDGHFAATLIEDLLVLRYLGDSTERCRKAFTAAWSTLRPQALNKPAHAPRIWAT